MLSLICAAALLAADFVLRFFGRRGKLNRTFAGGRIRLETLDNRGMAGGAMKNHPRLVRILPCGALLAALAVLWGEFVHGQNLCRWGAAMLCAGGLGNVLERLIRGGVTDYIRFPRLPGKRLRRLVWNLADFMILAGTLLLAAGSLGRQS